MYFKQLSLAVLCSAVILTAKMPSFAGVLAFDNFDYADGSLVPNGGWASHSGTAGDMLVSGGQVVVQHGSPSEDANLAFAGTAGDLYYGIDFSVSASANISGTDNEYFAHFKDSGNNFSARLDVVAPVGGGNYTVGIASDDSTADAIWGSDLTFGTTYRAVVKYDQIANIATLWIDAAAPGDISIVGDDQPDPGDDVVQFALRQSDSDLNETIFVDNLVIGTTFDDVVNAIPEPTSIVLMFAGLMGIAASRRR